MAAVANAENLKALKNADFQGQLTALSFSKNEYNIANSGLAQAVAALKAAPATLAAQKVVQSQAIANTTAAYSVYDSAFKKIAPAINALNAASVNLTQVQASMAPGLEAAQWVAANGISDILNIQDALATMSGMNMTMKMTAMIRLSTPVTLDVSVDFADLPGTGRAVAEVICPGITLI